MDLTRLTELSFYGNPLWKWILAPGVAFVVYFALIFIKSFAVRHLTRLAERTANKIDDFAAELLRRQTKTVFLLLIAVVAGTQVLSLPENVDSFIGKIAVIVLCLQGAFWINGVFSLSIAGHLQRKRKEGDLGSVSAFGALGVVARMCLWSLVLLVILNNLGINITALVAGLGIGGVAIALATQSILGDVFASISIALDKPFVIGDFIIVGDLLGTVEHIGLKTTRVRSLSGEQLIFSNNDLLSSRIRNYKRMKKRRILFSIGVTYQTPYEKLTAIPKIIREIFDSVERADLDRAHFKSYGDFALIFEIVYYVAVPDYNTYMDIQQHVNLELYRRFVEEGIVFAYPTQTLFLEKTASWSPAPEASSLEESP